MTDITDLVRRLADRAPDSHKGSFGRLVIYAGSENMTGCLVLAVQGALRSGAGLVEAASVKPALDVLKICAPEAVCTPLTGDLSADAGMLLKRLGAASAFAAGPGLCAGDTRGARGAALAELIRAVADGTSVPCVLDADALSAVGRDTGILRAFGGRAVVTPHPGELSKLTGVSAADIQNDRERMCREFAASAGCVCLLKGHGTVISDGENVAVNPTGNPYMARGGSGDVLTGIVGALLAQGFAPFDAARLGALIHGAAGDLAAKDLGIAALPSDLPFRIGRALTELMGI